MIIKINPVDDSFLTPFRELISDYIAELLFERMKTVNDAKLSETIFEKIRCPEHGRFSGILIEKAAHSTFQCGYDMVPSGITMDAPPHPRTTTSFLFAVRWGW
jgi:hypothetical protein